MRCFLWKCLKSAPCIITPWCWSIKKKTTTTKKQHKNCSSCCRTATFHKVHRPPRDIWHQLQQRERDARFSPQRFRNDYINTGSHFTLLHKESNARLEREKMSSEMHLTCSYTCFTIFFKTLLSLKSVQNKKKKTQQGQEIFNILTERATDHCCRLSCTLMQKH